MRALICLLLALPAHAQEPAPVEVVASFYPLADFARRIGGDRVRVEVATPAGGDPAGWRPSADQIQALQRAELILINGANFEAWPRWVALPFNRTVDTTRGVQGQLLTYESAIEHQHGSKGAHDHSGVDGHTWLDPQIAAAQAAAVHAGLVRARPAQRAAFDAGMAALQANLTALDRRLAAARPPRMVANHPAYNYLARRYRWDLTSFNLDPAAMPPAETTARVRAAGAQVMLWESQPSPPVAAHFAALGLRNVVFSPVERAPDAADFVAAMNANLDRLLR